MKTEDHEIDPQTATVPVATLFELRAEVERLQARVSERLRQTLARSDSDEEAPLRAEVERLLMFIRKVALFSNDWGLAEEASWDEQPSMPSPEEYH